jgi:hypothetical protein
MFVLIWSGWGLVTAGIGLLGFFVFPRLGLGFLVGFILAALLNFLFVRWLETQWVSRNGRTFTRAQESTLFLIPLHYWTYLFVITPFVMMVLRR